MQRINWDWYGVWIVDWLTCDDAWEAYDIWEKSYREANPDLDEARENSYMNDESDGPGTTMDLIENHYHQSLIVLEESFAYKLFTLLWDISSLIRRGKRRHQM